jgi:glycosyltransferase involved in cell wall biosynthesis
VAWSCSSDRFLFKRLGKELEKESLVRKIFSRLDRYLFFKTLKKIDFIILQSFFQKKLLEENWKLSGMVIYNGVKVPRFTPTEKEPLILWIGRLQKLKHPERFVDLALRFKDMPYKFTIMGREIEQLAHKEKFSKIEEKTSNFKYLGEIERDNVLGWLEKAKLLVNTSEVEGFSNTFIEAWVNGVPVVSLKVDPDGLIQSQGLGFVSSSMNQMVKDVENLMQDDMLWKNVSSRCREFAEKNFSIVKKAEELEALISIKNQ